MQLQPFTMVSGCTKGNKEWDQISKYVRPYQAAWAEANGGEYLFLTIEPDRPDGRHPSWWKLKTLADLYKQDRNLFWLDIDAIPLRTLTAEMLAPEAGRIRFLDDTAALWNSGGMILPGEDWVSEFLTYWWNEANAEDLAHCWHDQLTMGRIGPRMPERMGKHISRDWICHPCGYPQGDYSDYTKMGQLWMREAEYFPPKTT